MSPFSLLPARPGDKPRRAKLTADTLEDRIVPAVYRTVDGTGNNLANPTWGSTNVAQIRLTPAAYADAAGTPVTAGKPGARAVSNAAAAHIDGEVKNDRDLSNFLYAWGQFIDHDLDLTNTGTEAFNIPVPTGDAYFDPAGTGTQVIPLKRSIAATGTPVRTPTNAITAFLDGSMVYGSDATTAATLRTFSGGAMKTGAGNLPATDAAGFFLVGDVRGNENVELTAVQALFVREHNRIAAHFRAKNPAWSDETIYQEARRRVIAEIGAITFNEYLPTLLGKAAPGPYQGYKPTVNPGVSVEFSTAAFRFGHSMLGDDVEFFDNSGNEVRDAVSLKDAFFNPALLRETGVDPILKYLASDNAEELDSQVVDSLRNFLFGPPGAGGLDLAALNIQRGRDHGLGTYNQLRTKFGLPAAASFADISRDPETQARLRAAYGTVDKVELWVGGLSEDHVAGGSVGPTFGRIIADQFTRVRAGDRFWYENEFAGAELDALRKTTLSDVIRRNTGVRNLQPNAFVFRAEIAGRVYADLNRNGTANPGEQGLANRTVQLLAADGTVLATTRTDRNGLYRFSGLSVGTDYRVRVVPPPGAPHLPAKTVAIVGGGAVFVDLGEPPPPPRP